MQRPYRPPAMIILAFGVSLVTAFAAGAAPPPDHLEVRLFPFVGTSFVEIFAEDFTHPESPLVGEDRESFLERVRSTPPFVLPVVDPETGEILAPTGGNILGEPAAMEMPNGRLLARVSVLGTHDSPTIPFRFNGLLDSVRAREELEFFADRPLLGSCGRPHTEFPQRYALRQEQVDSLTKLVGLDIDGDPTNCTFVDDPETHEDESSSCDAENLPGPDHGADITRDDWRPRTAIGELTLGRFIEARGTLRAWNRPNHDSAQVEVSTRGLLPGEVYTIWEVDTDPLGRPLPEGFAMGGAPANIFKPNRQGKARFRSELIHNPIGAEMVEIDLPGLPTVEIPSAATVVAVLVWHTNAETNGGLDFNVHVGGGLRGA